MWKEQWSWETKGFGVKIMDLAERVVEAVRYAFQKLGAH